MSGRGLGEGSFWLGGGRGLDRVLIIRIVIYAKENCFVFRA